MMLVAEQMNAASWLAAMVFAILCFLLSGVNALILYSFIAGVSKLAAKVLGRSSG